MQHKATKTMSAPTIDTGIRIFNDTEKHKEVLPCALGKMFVLLFQFQHGNNMLFLNKVNLRVCSMSMSHLFYTLCQILQLANICSNLATCKYLLEFCLKFVKKSV